MHFGQTTSSPMANRQTAERRWASRTPLWMKVSLYQHGDLIKYGLTNNFSLSGLFIICNQHNLKPGQHIEVIFGHDLDGAEKNCTIPVEVKRISNDGVAVYFYKHDNNSFFSIQKMLSAKKTAIANYSTIEAPAEQASNQIAVGYNKHT